MDISQFYIGLVFNSGGGFEYRCTDVGTRTVLAVLLSGIDPVFVEGPPYIQTEEVFSEHSLKRCFLTVADALVHTQEADAHHPGFTTEEVKRMMAARFAPEIQSYPRKNLLKANRDLESDVAHPYAISHEESGIVVHYLTLKTKQFETMEEVKFARLPLTTPDSLKAKIC
ncbi:hypothetical protein IFT48_00490 [Pseudomonas fluorescens]|uniref:hypothetical protein n=1 Tax=Pseudomonas TaxID=286 RepID=UPI001780F32D|nr:MULTISPECIES: hypothetical protein [Pseudomonas]MBD8088468.1 hypothetical protein [Pseudomonas fluorescens]MBD8681239.1 hypothetical protein [Pseudomonas sp. CFBP 13719]